jgi:hypothetical protein
MDGLQPLIKINKAKMEEMRKTKQMITTCQAQIDAHENVEFEPLRLPDELQQILRNLPKFLRHSERRQQD